MDPITIVGIVVASILGGILLFMLGKLTINAVRKIRKNAQAKAAIIDMKSFIAQAVKNPIIIYIYKQYVFDSNRIGIK